MKYYKWYAVSLLMVVQIIAGCGGGGGGGTVVLPPADTTAPTLSSFSLSSTSASLTVPISSLTATDNVGVTGFMITEGATAPAASASGWSASAPASFSFTSAGTKTAYAWAKDAAGNVSSALSAATNIILTDTTAPTLSSFSLSSTSAS
ncbi:MAG: hypothetical protein PHF56_17180, partial [Desulfuromonadaceae bacterium]|nr:hypothetical protein [Desulfuromonadaceae bacterium]